MNSDTIAILVHPRCKNEDEGAMIPHSNSEFVIDFIRLMPGVQKAKVKARIVITPEHAVRLLLRSEIM